MIFVMIFVPFAAYAVLRDPTAPPELAHEEVIPQDGFLLQSILVSSKQKVAIINGDIVGLGETIRGAKLVAIGNNYVRLLQKGKSMTLYLITEDVRK